MNFKWTATLMCLTGVFFSISAHADIVVDSAVFDKVYIPALALTSQGEIKKSQAVMAQLKQSWHVYEKMHRQDFPGDDNWTNGFKDIGEWINKADAIVTSGDELVEAHNALEHVREILMQLRKKNKIDYYLDYQTAFHEPMEEIVLAAKGKSPTTFSEQDLEKMRHMIADLDARWQDVLHAKFDPKIFVFDSTQAAKVKQVMEQESAAINSLKESVANSDKAAVIQRAIAIKPPFAKLYMMFGEFGKK